MRVIKAMKERDGSPPALDWDEYALRASEEWQQILNVPDQTELPVQRFLEENPSFVPGASGEIDSGPSGHYPFPGGVIAQPPLRALGARIPDFMWIATDSATIQPYLIEIERPTKRWFTSGNGSNVQFTAELTQALSQLTQWRAWLEDPVNRQWFRDYYKLPDWLWRSRRLEPHFVLVFGRRSEFASRESVNRLRNVRALACEHYMTLDRLGPSARARNFATVKIGDDGYIAHHWSPTAKMSNLPESLRIVANKCEAVDRCKWLSNERKTFIKQALPAWDQWDGTADDAPAFLEERFKD